MRQLSQSSRPRMMVELDIHVNSVRNLSRNPVILNNISDHIQVNHLSFFIIWELYVRKGVCKKVIKPFSDKHCSPKAKFTCRKQCWFVGISCINLIVSAVYWFTHFMIVEFIKTILMLKKSSIICLFCWSVVTVVIMHIYVVVTILVIKGG